MDALQYAIPGEPVSARQFNALIDAIRALQNLEVGPGLEVGRSPAGNLRLNLTVGQFDALVPVVITVVHGPQPGPAYPEAYTYDVQGVKSPGLVVTNLAPALGRPAVDQEAAIYPAEVGCRAFLIRYRDENGDIAGADLFIPPGGKGAAPGGASGFRGERLAFTECEQSAGLLDQLVTAVGVAQVDRLLGADTGGTPVPLGNEDTGGTPVPLKAEEPQPMTLINVRQRADIDDARLRLDVDSDAILIDVPPEAVAASFAASLIEDDTTTQTWATSQITVKAVIGNGAPVNFLSARTFPAGGGLVQLDETDLAGVRALEFRRSGTKESAGIAQISGGFIVLTPAVAGPGGSPPVPTSIPRIAVSGAARPAGPAAPAGD